MKYMIFAAAILAAAVANAFAKNPETSPKPLEPTLSCGAALAAAVTLDQPSVPKTRVVRFIIKGMLNENCPILVKAAVSRIPGVQRVEANLQTKSATVEYREGSTTVRQIQQVIKDKTGFDAELAR